MSLFGDDDNIFGRGGGGDSSTPDLWSLPQPKSTSPKDRISGILAGVSVPQSYGQLFDKANPTDGRIRLVDLELIVQQSGLDSGTGELIVNLVTKGKSQQHLGRDSWNVAMALIGLAQNGEDDLGLDAVDFSRSNLPEVKIGNSVSGGGSGNGHSVSAGPPSSATPLSVPLPFSRESSIGSEFPTPPPAPVISGWGNDESGFGEPSNVINVPPLGSTESPLPPLPGTDSNQTSAGSTNSSPWTNYTSDPSNYIPTSKDTITITLAPEREGIFMFRHVVYHLQGTINYSEYSNAPKSFKVVRRYSNFLWLQDCLVKKYPFRLLPVLPPKRLAVDGRYLSSDSYFLERRRRGLSRFMNQLVKHPLLRKDKLVVMFLTVDTEPSVWQKQASLKVEEEFTQRIISPAFVAKWSQEEEIARWRSVIEASDQSLEAITQLCFVADRVARRHEAMSADYNKMTQAFSSLSQTLPNVYFHPSGDIPVISAGVGSAIKHTATASTLLRDESKSLDIGFLEELKQLREFLTSFKVSFCPFQLELPSPANRLQEIFVRYEKFGGNKIDELQKRMEGNTVKINQMTNRPDTRESEVLRLREFIANDKKTIEKQRNRDWLIKECITEEIVLFQRTQYQISK